MPRKKKSPDIKAQISPLYNNNTITEKTASTVVESGYSGRLQAAFELQRKSPELVSLRQELAWVRSKLQDDVQMASEFNVGINDLRSVIRKLSNSLEAIEEGDSDRANSEIHSAIAVLTDLERARGVEESVLRNMKVVADLVTKEASRSRVMESVPTADEWDVFRKVFLGCVYDGIREFNGLPKATADKIWENIQENFRSRMILEPEEVAVVRMARERRNNEQS